MKMGCLADWHERQSSKGWNITMNCIIWDTRDSVPEEYDSQICIEDHENLRSCLDHGLFNPVWHELDDKQHKRKGEGERLKNIYAQTNTLLIVTQTKTNIIVQMIITNQKQFA